MSTYLTRLKEIRNNENFNNSLITQVSKVPEASFDTFDTPSQEINEKKLNVSANETIEIELIRSWLYSIGEPEGDHGLVIQKCRNDLDELRYYLRHVNGEFL